MNSSRVDVGLLLATADARWKTEGRVEPQGQNPMRFQVCIDNNLNVRPRNATSLCCEQIIQHI
eukprot:9476331-Pyramimonas_sp.AAC.1